MANAKSLMDNIIFEESDYQEIVGKAFGDMDFKVDDRVILPSWYRLKNRQRRVNVILFIHKAYIFMAAMKKSGEASEDRRASVYWPISKVSSLRRFKIGLKEKIMASTKPRVVSLNDKLSRRYRYKQSIYGDVQLVHVPDSGPGAVRFYADTHRIANQRYNAGKPGAALDTVCTAQRGGVIFRHRDPMVNKRRARAVASEWRSLMEIRQRKIELDLKV